MAPKPTLDDHCALELHRSKSYIVNLIDRALSKELGTVPNERTKKQVKINFVYCDDYDANSNCELHDVLHIPRLLLLFYYLMSQNNYD